MKRMLLVADPLDGPTSVQFELLASLSRGLSSQYSVVLFTPHCGPDRARALTELGFEVRVGAPEGFRGNRVLERLGEGNESMLWAESWLREVAFHKNELEAARNLGREGFDVVVNLSMTVPFPSDIWWIQGTPLDLTLRGMADSNLVARLADLAGRSVVASLDGALQAKVRKSAGSVIANSPYLRELYRSRGVPVDGVVYTLKDFGGFTPRATRANRDYVLLYIGKETPTLNVKPLRQAGVKVVGFGNKIPAATRLRNYTDWVDFRGPVTHDELVSLYSNALFTLFPFSFEPLGFVPIESMACGTPVLTFNRQGPASTIVDGRTGWLVGTPAELVAKAAEIWRRGDTGIPPGDCVQRAREFSPQRSVADLLRWTHLSESRRSGIPRASP